MPISRHTLLSGPSIGPQRGPAQQLVVFLHGWGADGNDLIGLAPAWQATLPHTHFVSPNAPDPCDQNPMGRQWFGFQEADPGIRNGGHVRAAELINAFLDHSLENLGLGNNQLALVGFSQGAMMAIHVGLRRVPRVAAVVAYSGMLIADASLASETVSRPPVFLCHGDEDPVVPFKSMDNAVTALGSLDVPVQWHRSCGIGHGIDQGGLAAGGSFLTKAFREA